jgi:hypothetical protein
LLSGGRKERLDFMSSAVRVLAVAAAMSLFGAAGSLTATASAGPQIKNDCFYQVLPAGNGFPTYLLTNGTLVQNGTVSTGQDVDVTDVPTTMTDSHGTTLVPQFPPVSHVWLPYSNSAGTVLLKIIVCDINTPGQ